MFKTLPPALALALPLTAGLAGLLERSAQADVIPVCIPPSITPECSDGVDNDGDRRVDAADPECVGSSDYAEGLPDHQGPPCDRADIVLWDQFLWNPWPVCPECGFTLIDWRDILTTPIDELIEGVHPDWQVSVVMKLQQPVQGVFDDPSIPNLRVRYRGQQRIGPGSIGTVLKFGDPGPETSLRYVGRAWDAHTGKMVVNVGVLNPQQ
jgi:hypothetical protein